MMAKSKKKDDFEAVIDDLKENVSKMINKCISNNKKMDKYDIELYGIPQEEIDKNKKLIKAIRRPEESLVKKVEMYKVDPVTILKQDKTVKLAKAAFLKKGKKKKAPKSKMDMSSTVGASDLGSMMGTSIDDDMNVDGLDGEGIDLDETLKNGIDLDGEDDEKDGDGDKDDNDADQGDGED